MDRAAVEELLARVKAATEPDREIDAAITALFFDAAEVEISQHYSIQRDYYTSSLDAIVASIERELPGRWWSVDGPSPDAGASIQRLDGDWPFAGLGATPALACCAAFLSALAANAGEKP